MDMFGSVCPRWLSKSVWWLPWFSVLFVIIFFMICLVFLLNKLGVSWIKVWLCWAFYWLIWCRIFKYWENWFMVMAEINWSYGGCLQFMVVVLKIWYYMLELQIEVRNMRWICNRHEQVQVLFDNTRFWLGKTFMINSSFCWAFVYAV